MPIHPVAGGGVGQGSVGQGRSASHGAHLRRKGQAGEESVEGRVLVWNSKIFNLSPPSTERLIWNGKLPTGAAAITSVPFLNKRTAQMSVNFRQNPAV
jgi:hypothetical protein